MYLRLLNCSSKAHGVGGNAVVAFKFHMDRLFGEASTRKTNAAGYLIRIRESTPQLEPGGKTEKKGGYTRTRVRVLVIDHPCAWSPRSRQDRQILCPPDLNPIVRFSLLHKIYLCFFWAWISGGRCIISGSPGPCHGNSAAHGKRRLCRPT